MTQFRIAALAVAVMLSACGGGGTDSPSTPSAVSALSSVSAAESLSLQVARQCERFPNQKGCPAPAPVIDPTPTTTTPTSTSTTPSTTTTTATPTTTTTTTTVTPVPSIAVADHDGQLLQTGPDTAAYWLDDGVWGAVGMTKGTYTGPTGTTYEQKIGVSDQFGPNGEVAGRITWKFPDGPNEVKSYPSFLVGNKPGYYNSWIVPGGHPVMLLDGTQSQVYPSGKTPGSIFPLQLPIASLKSTFSYTHNAAPTGQGHLSWDIWLQNTPDQGNGFYAPPITHEIMIPLDYWGGYGAYPNRNPSWYDSDAVIDGRLWHIYISKNVDGTFTPNFAGGWKFIVFEPDQPGIPPGSINLAAFINYLTTRKDSAGTPWATSANYMVSAELGVETVNGTGDLTISNFRVFK